MENSVDTICQSDVVIIGAGPAGLALGSFLHSHKIAYAIIEQDQLAGASWRKMPDHLHLITLWKSNYLVPEDKNLFHPYHKSSATEFAAYMEDLAVRKKLNIIVNCKVENIAQDRNGFTLNSSKGIIRSRIVVDCRGVFHSPFSPEYKMTGIPPVIFHFKDYKNRSQLKGYKNILIVGKKLSAGQLISELSAEGKHNLFLSIRSKLAFGPPELLLNFFLRHLDVFEKLRTLFSPNVKGDTDVPMDHAVKKIIKKSVEVLPDIDFIEGKIVVFKNGEQRQIDAILFATGFTFHPASLKDDFESAEMANLFFLGRNTQRTFASRFIRGIREDAIILGKRIEAILGKRDSSNKFQ